MYRNVCLAVLAASLWAMPLYADLGDADLGDADLGDADSGVAACKDLVMAYAYYRDRGDAQGVAEVFSEDAVFNILGQTFTGRDAIRQRIEDAKDGPVYRHLMSTVHVEQIDTSTAWGVSYVTVFQSASGELPLSSNQFMATGEYKDQFKKTSAGWKIARRDFQITINPPAQPTQ